MLKRNLPFPFHKRIPAASLLSALLVMIYLLPVFPIYSEPTADSGWSGTAANGFASGSGQKSDPYLIDTPEQLAYLAQSVNAGNDYSGKYLKLTSDLLLNDLTDYQNWAQQQPAHEWIPIGGYVSLSVPDESGYQEAFNTHNMLYLRTETGYTPADRYIENAIYYCLTAFQGNLDGDGHTISGLYLSSDYICAGLFGACKNASLSNLTLCSSFIQGTGEIGGLAGTLCASNSSSITGCRVEANISASAGSAGGIVGEIVDDSTGGSISLTDCSFAGCLSANSQAGGIVGSVQQNTGKIHIESCGSSAYISAQTAAGGITGSLKGAATLLNCSNYGSISAEIYAGGIAGEICSTDGYITVSECTNDAAVVCLSAAGGIAGLCSAFSGDTDAFEIAAELLSCVNLGDIFAAEEAGGIAGSCRTDGNIAKVNLIGCKNSASVSGNQKIGGIAGQLNAEGGILTLGSSENYGTVTADNEAGGIAGDVSASAELSLYQCFSYAAITVQNSCAGGIAGRLTVSGRLLLELSCTNGSVKATGNAGGIAGSQLTQSDEARCVITNCFSNVILTAQENAGGITGSIYAQTGQTTVSNCLFYGSFTSGCKLSGGISAYAHAETSASTVQINQCYYQQSAASRPVLLYGGQGSELCQSSEGLSDDSLKNADLLTGLDFNNLWKTGDEENAYPTLRSVPFVWENYQYTVTGKTATVLSYQGRSDIALIPSKLGGVSVTTIADSAFQNSSIIKAVLPDSIITIGESAFSGCQNLKSITLSTALRTVGTGAFKGCISLETKRCASSLSELYTGSDNAPFDSLSIVQPVTLQINYCYENGSTAAPNTTLSCYAGDYYRIEAPEITGFQADESALTGICTEESKLTVIYRLGSYLLTVQYLYPDGSLAAPAYTASYRFGENYSISSPDISGYLPSLQSVEGAMEGADLVLTVYYNEQLINQSNEHSANVFLLIVLLICSCLALICCIGYFIFRYRSIHQPNQDDSDFQNLLTRRF